MEDKKAALSKLWRLAGGGATGPVEWSGGRLGWGQHLRERRSSGQNVNFWSQIRVVLEAAMDIVTLESSHGCAWVLQSHLPE